MNSTSILESYGSIQLYNLNHNSVHPTMAVINNYMSTSCYGVYIRGIGSDENMLLLLNKLRDTVFDMVVLIEANKWMSNAKIR